MLKKPARREAQRTEALPRSCSLRLAGRPFQILTEPQTRNKKRGWRIRSSTLLNLQMRRNYSALQKVRS